MRFVRSNELCVRIGRSIVITTKITDGALACWPQPEKDDRKKNRVFRPSDGLGLPLLTSYTYKGSETDTAARVRRKQAICEFRDDSFTKTNQSSHEVRS